MAEKTIEELKEENENLNKLLADLIMCIRYYAARGHIYRYTDNIPSDIEYMLCGNYVIEKGEKAKKMLEKINKTIDNKK